MQYTNMCSHVYRIETHTEHTDMHTCTHAHMHVCTRAHLHEYMHAYIHTHARTHARMHTKHTCTHSCIHTQTHNTDLHAQLCTHLTHTRRQEGLRLHPCSLRPEACADCYRWAGSFREGHVEP